MATRNRQATKSTIPEFTSREQEAEYWDTHSFADHWDEARPVAVRFARNLSGGMTIRLDPDTQARLRAIAHEKGIGPTTLVRMWILERPKAMESEPKGV